MVESSKYGETFERQVKQLLDAHSVEIVRQDIYKLAKEGKLSVKLITVLEEIRRVESLDRQNQR
jgi:hypothetical protein